MVKQKLNKKAEAGDNPSLQPLENKMKELHYQAYEEWVKNFALNLENIWKESSARQLDPSLNPNYKKENHSAIVIGRGPSLIKHKHLELLKKSDYKGHLVCADGALKTVLESGVTPENFLNFYVVTIEPYDRVKKFYDNKIVDTYGSKIKGIFPIIASPNVVERARQAGIKIHWFHSLFDYNEGKKSFNQISAIITRAKNHLKGLPALQTGANAGTAAWFVSWRILKCSTVALIGINHGWEEDDPWEKIISHGYEASTKKIDKKNPSFRKLIKKIYNPEFKCYSILDPIYYLYSTTFKEFIGRSPSWLNTINATEGGSIFGNRITCIPFKKFLQQYKT